MINLSPSYIKYKQEKNVGQFCTGYEIPHPFGYEVKKNPIRFSLIVNLVWIQGYDLRNDVFLVGHVEGE